MGNRNLTVVQKNGEYKLAQYGQWNAHPSQLGADLLNFLKIVDINALNSAMEQVSFFTQKELDEYNQCRQRQKDLANLCKMMYQDMSDDLVPPLLRELTPEFHGMEALIYILFLRMTKTKNSINFAADSSFCEWAYVIDLDHNQFEIYEGDNTEKLNETDRFFFLEEKAVSPHHPVKLVKSYDIANLPDKEQFLSDLGVPDLEAWDE